MRGLYHLLPLLPLRAAPIALSAVLLLAACSGAAPTTTPHPTPTPSPTPTPPTVASCSAYGSLTASVSGGRARFAVTSFRCAGLHVDSTARSPSEERLTLAGGETLALLFDAPSTPTSIEARLYAGTGIVGSFLRWPEELPTGATPAERAVLDAALTTSYAPSAPAGSYTVVVRAAWGTDVDVFYALELSLD